MSLTAQPLVFSLYRLAAPGWRWSGFFMELTYEPFVNSGVDTAA